MNIRDISIWTRHNNKKSVDKTPLRSFAVVTGNERGFSQVTRVRISLKMTNFEFKNFTGMSSCDFDVLLNLMGPLIVRHLNSQRT